MNMNAPTYRPVPAIAQELIKHEVYFYLDNVAHAGILKHQAGEPVLDLGYDPEVLQELKLGTVCVLILHNGHKVVGSAFCVDPARYNADLGRRMAREDAMRQLNHIAAYMSRHGARIQSLA